jgi:hypothetical protein
MKNLFFEEPSQATQAELLAHTLRESSYFDLLDGQLQRAKAIAALIACAASRSREIRPDEMAEAAWLICNEIDRALIVLNGMAEEAKREKSP